MAVHYSFINSSDFIFNVIYVIGNVLFLWDSVLYMAGYFVYVNILREAIIKGVIKATVAEKIM